MKTGQKRIAAAGIFVTIALVVAALWFFWLRPAGSLSAAWNVLIHPAGTVSPGTLKASGTVEITVLSIAPELPGKIIAVDFQEGDAVKAGEVLVQLDDTTLQIQRRIAVANLEAARLALQKLAGPTVIANMQKTIAQDEQAIRDARQALDVQQYYATNTTDLQNAKANLFLAEKALDNARTAYDKVNGDPATDTNKAAAYQKYYQVEQAYDKVLYIYQMWNGESNQEQNDLKKANLALAKARLVENQAFLAALNGGLIPENATGPGIAQLQQARMTLQAAQARLKLLDDQISTMTVTAPVDAVVMRRSADPGNVVSPGSELLTLASLNDLTITVYIPEDSYRKIKLGQAATVSVDSFPSELFHAVVKDISAELEFLPRTTYTASGDQLTVHAIRLELVDAAGKLKPGMTVEVDFIQE
jgi:HlyD family secretion protein